MPERRFSANNSYRYGFNGKENDNEVKGDGTQIDYGGRMYDSRIGRWLSIDPLQQKYPSETPYLYTGGNPVYFADPDGKDRIDYYKVITDKGTVLIKVVTEHAFKAEAQSTLGGQPDLVKFNYNVYTTIDLRGGKLNVTSKEETDYSSLVWDIGLGEYLQIKATGKDDGLLIHTPQVVIYGSGTEDPGWGSKADPSRGIYSINFAEFADIMGDVMVGMKDYTLKDPKGIVLKIPDLEYRVGKAVIKKLNEHESIEETSSSPTNTSSNTKQTSVKRSTPLRNGSKWEYYTRDKNGKFVQSGRTGGLADSTVKGKNGAPDTVYRRPFKAPPVPKKDIKRN